MLCVLLESQQGLVLSEDVVLIRVAAFESSRGAFVQESFGFRALVLVIIVGLHASSEFSKVIWAELGKDGLSWRIFILSWEAKGRHY